MRTATHREGGHALRWLLEPMAARALAGAVLAATLCGACGNGLNVPRPGGGASRTIPAAPASTVSLPVTIDLTQPLSQAETAVPRELRQQGDWQVVDKNTVGDLGIRYVVRRDPLAVAVSGRRAEVTARLKYSVEAAQRVPKPFVGGSFWQTLGTCGRDEPLREAIVGLRTEFGIDANWRITSKSVLLPTTFVHQCRMTFLGINVTDKVAESMRSALGRAAATVDQRVAQAGDLRPAAERAWRWLAEPVQLAPGVWLQIAPRSASLVQFGGNGTIVTATLGIEAQPRVVVGDKPRSDPASLPRLSEGAAREGFHVTIDAEISFAELNRQLRTHLAGTRHRVGTREVVVNTVEAYGAGDTLVMGLGLSGDLQGTVYFVGDPRLDPTTGTISMDGLDFSVETRDALVKVADWLNHESFRRSVVRQTTASLGDQLERISEEVQNGINRELAPGVLMSGTVKHLRAVDVYVTGQGLIARAVLDGDARVMVK